MGIVILVVLILVAIVGTIAFVLVKAIHATDPKNMELNKQSVSNTAQEFLPYVDVKDSTIDLGNFQFRAILECSSINYNLKTEGEQEIIELSYQRFLNSLNHPIQLFIQTRTMDNTKMMENLNADIEKTIQEFPNLETYGIEYSACMDNLYDEIQNNKEKKKYIVIPYNETGSLGTEEERYENSLKELQSRCQIISEALQGIGVKCTRLNTKSLVGLLYELNHKDSASQVDNITSGEFLTMMVEEEVDLTESSANNEAVLDWILYEAQNRLNVELFQNETSTENERERVSQIMTELNRLRSDLAGFYKEESDIYKKVNKYERGVS